MLFRLLAENNPNGVILYDFQEDKIVYANRVFLKMLKYQEEEEVIGKSILAFVDPKDLERVKMLIERVKAGLKRHAEVVSRLTTKK